MTPRPILELAAFVSPTSIFPSQPMRLFSNDSRSKALSHTHETHHSESSEPFAASSTMSSDFDEIFGDLKEDQSSAPTLTNDLGEANIFGDDSRKPNLATKDAPVAPTPMNQGGSSKQPWESIGSREQDDFLSWLDDGSAPSACDATQTDSSCDSSAYSTVEIGEGAGANVVSSLPPVETAPNESLPPPIPVHSHIEPRGVSTVSLDDDDDDDYLEKIIEKAKQQQQASNSRENSDTSLQIKSQLNAQRVQELIGTSEPLVVSLDGIAS